MEKSCNKCNIKKPIELFPKGNRCKDGHRNICIKCISLRNKIRKQNNREKTLNYQREYYAKNKNRINELDNWRYQRDKEKRLALCKKIYTEKNKEIRTRENKKYHENKINILAKRQAIRKSDPEKYREYAKNRRKVDPFYKMKTALRSRLTKAFHFHSTKKRTSTVLLLGADFIIVKKHIERQFTKGMSWENYGDWHIDHTIPLASAHNEQELLVLCHYRNLQPLWAHDNIAKKDKIPNVQLKIAI